MKTINPRNCVHRLKISVKKSPNQLPLCIALKKSKFVCSDTPIYIYIMKTHNICSCFIKNMFTYLY